MDWSWEKVAALVGIGTWIYEKNADKPWARRFVVAIGSISLSAALSVPVSERIGWDEIIVMVILGVIAWPILDFIEAVLADLRKNPGFVREALKDRLSGKDNDDGTS